jgi:hypothetical protein
MAAAAPAVVVAAEGPSDVVVHHAAPQIADKRKQPPCVVRLLSPANQDGFTSGLYR